MEFINTWNINRYICKVLHKARIMTLTCLLSYCMLDIKILNFNHLTHVLLCLVQYYNIEKSSFNAVSASLVLFQPEDQLQCYLTSTNEEVDKVVMETMHLNRHVQQEVKGPRQVTLFCLHAINYVICVASVCKESMLTGIHHYFSSVVHFSACYYTHPYCQNQP